MHFFVDNVHMCMKQVSHTVPFFLLPELFFFASVIERNEKKLLQSLLFINWRDPIFCYCNTTSSVVFGPPLYHTFTPPHTIPITTYGRGKNTSISSILPRGGSVSPIFLLMSTSKKEKLLERMTSTKLGCLGLATRYKFLAKRRYFRSDIRQQ